MQSLRNRVAEVSAAGETTRRSQAQRLALALTAEDAETPAEDDKEGEGEGEADGSDGNDGSGGNDSSGGNDGGGSVAEERSIVPNGPADEGASAQAPPRAHPRKPTAEDCEREFRLLRRQHIRPRVPPSRPPRWWREVRTRNTAANNRLSGNVSHRSSGLRNAGSGGTEGGPGGLRSPTSRRMLEDVSSERIPPEDDVAERAVEELLRSFDRYQVST